MFLLHFPSARAAQALPGTLPGGVRTFLGSELPRPPGPLDPMPLSIGDWRLSMCAGRPALAAARTMPDHHCGPEGTHAD